MKVNVMELCDTGEHETDTTLLQVDNRTLITVVGFGHGPYKWKVASCNPDGNPDYDPMAILGEYSDWIGIPDKEGFIHGGLSQAMVWATHITFAHVVMDLIHNQW